jgi:two-component system, OmpR family, response regulator QseB
MKVLIAEDDVNLGEQIVYRLKKQEGYEVEWVLDGEEAYHTAVHSFYDVVILDWMMPNGNGEERNRGNGFRFIDCTVDC